MLSGPCAGVKALVQPCSLPCMRVPCVPVSLSIPLRKGPVPAGLEQAAGHLPSPQPHFSSFIHCHSPPLFSPLLFLCVLSQSIRMGLTVWPHCVIAIIITSFLLVLPCESTKAHALTYALHQGLASRPKARLGVIWALAEGNV